MTATVALVALVASLVTTKARANDASDDGRHRLLLELGADAGLALGNICERSGDVGGCAPAQGAAGFSGYAGWLLGQRLSLGAFAAYQWAPNTGLGGQNGTAKSPSDTVLWMAAEGRWMSRSRRVHVKATLGAVRYRQEYHPDDPQMPVPAVSQWAPAAGLGAAWVLLNPGRLTVALDVRLWITAFGSDPPLLTSDRTAKDLRVLLWCLVGLHFGVRQ